jgi:hypothetical protein
VKTDMSSGVRAGKVRRRRCCLVPTFPKAAKIIAEKWGSAFTAAATKKGALTVLLQST